MKAKDILASKQGALLSIAETSTVHQAVEIFVQHKVGFLIVKNKYGNVSGVLSERDVIRKCTIAKKNIEQVPVSDIMTMRNDITIGAETDDIESLMNTMTEKRIRHIPIFAEGQLTGIISIGDIVKIILDAKESEIKTLSSYVSGNYPG